MRKAITQRVGESIKYQNDEESCTRYYADYYGFIIVCR